MEDADHTDFGEIIRRLRQDVGLSQAELARTAGVHLRQIRRYESGEQQPVLPVAVVSPTPSASPSTSSPATE